MSPCLISSIRRMVNTRYWWVRDKDDLVQEACIAAWQAKPGCELVAAKRQCIDYLRKINPRSRCGRAPVFTSDMPVLVDPRQTPEDIAVETESMRNLARAVGKLDSIERRVADGLLAGESWPEMQERCGRSETWIMLVRRQVIEKLRAEIKSR